MRGLFIYCDCPMNRDIKVTSSVIFLSYMDFKALTCTTACEITRHLCDACLYCIINLAWSACARVSRPRNIWELSVSILGASDHFMFMALSQVCVLKPAVIKYWRMWKLRACLPAGKTNIRSDASERSFVLKHRICPADKIKTGTLIPMQDPERTAS